jgi:hypothetical protein
MRGNPLDCLERQVSLASLEPTDVGPLALQKIGELARVTIR